MLSKEKRQRAFRLLGFKSIKEFQKWAGLAADGKYGIKTDKQLRNTVKYTKKMLREKGKAKTIMLPNASVPKNKNRGVNKAVKEYQQKLKAGNKNVKVSGELTAAQRNKLDIEKSFVSKAKFRWQNRNGEINWSKVPYFKKAEFYNDKADKWKKADVAPYLLNMLIKIREHFKKPIQITSGVRSQKYNDSLVGSSKKSKHIDGKAADIYIKGVEREEIKKFALKQKNANYSYYGTPNMGQAVHVDVR